MVGQVANGYNITNRALCMKRPGRPEELDFRTKLRVSTAMVVLSPDDPTRRSREVQGSFHTPIVILKINGSL